MVYDRYVHDALHSMGPGETRLVRSRPCSPRSGTMTLITTSDRRKDAFVDGLRDRRKNVSCIQHDGTYFWLVQAPSGAAQRALRELGWVGVPASNSPTEGRAEPLKNGSEGRTARPKRSPKARTRRRLCGAWGDGTRRR